MSNFKSQMSFFGRNIKKIRTAKKISQTAFADLFSLKRGSIGAYEEGRAEAKIDTIIEIAEFYKLSVDQLLRKELTINEIYHISEKSQKFEKLISQINSDISIPLVKEKDRVEFIQKYSNQVYLQSLQTIKLPNLKPYHLAFEYMGSAMVANYSGIYHGDIIIAESFQIEKINEVTVNQIFIIIERENLYIARIIMEGEDFLLRHDNPIYADISIKKADVKTIWKANQLITNQLNQKSNLDSTLQNIENKIDKLLTL